MTKTMPVYRIAVDEVLGDGLVRIAFAELKPNTAGAVFDDGQGEWRSETVALMTEEKWRAKLGVSETNLNKYPFESLKEGDVFLCGNVRFNRSKGASKRFCIAGSNARRLLSVTAILKDDFKRLYAAALAKGGE